MTAQASYFPTYQTLYAETTPIDTSCPWEDTSSYGLLSPPFDSSAWPTSTSTTESFNLPENYSLPSFKLPSQDPYPTPNDESYIPRFIEDNLSNVTPLLSPLILQQNTSPELFIDTSVFQFKEAASSAYLQTPLSTPTREATTLRQSTPEYVDNTPFQLHFPHSYEPSTPNQSTAYSTPLSSPVRESFSSSPSDASYFENNSSYSNERLESPCKPFVMKLAHLLRNPELYADTICWDAAGTTFIVAPSDKLVNSVLPEVFSHCSVAAFSRQLNTYGFIHLNRQQLSEKFQYSPDTTTPVKELSAWFHPYFTRDGPCLLHRLLPRPSRARLSHQKAKNALLMEEGKTLKPLKVKSETKLPKKLKLSWK